MSYSFVTDSTTNLSKLSPPPASGTAAAALEANAAELAAASNRAPYLGQVATNCWLPGNATSSAAQFNSRTGHYARDSLTSLQIAFANFYGDTELSPGGTMTVEASIEYPVGTITRVTFGGTNAQTIADGAAGPLSDALPITIPRGGLFFVRSFATNAGSAGQPYFWSGYGGSPLIAGEYGASGVTSKVMTGSIAPGNGPAVYPCVIVASTRRPSVFMAGDSITAGLGDSYDDLTGDLGLVARSISPYFGSGGYAVSGGLLSTFVNNSIKRRALIAAYYTHVLTAYGFNDMGVNAAPGILASLAAFAAYPNFNGKKLWQTTITPQSSSTDSWATDANQTAFAATDRAKVNQQIVAGIPGYEGHFDTARQVEATYYGGKFRVDLGTPTIDGKHPSNAIYRMIRNSKAIDPALIRR